MRGKGPKAPFASLTLIIFLFGRKRPPEDQAPIETATPFQIPDILQKSVMENDVKKARDHLRIANLERDIIGGALTKIYEAETRGQLSESERNQLVQRYKADLKRIDSEIDDYKKIVDLSELESAKEDLLKSFQAKLLEIDQRINQIKPSIQHSLPPSPKPEMSTTDPTPKTESTETEQKQPTQKEKSPKEKPKNKAEERIDAIREEVLKAMERLEQIETEG